MTWDDVVFDKYINHYYDQVDIPNVSEFNNKKLLKNQHNAVLFAKLVNLLKTDEPIELFEAQLNMLRYQKPHIIKLMHRENWNQLGSVVMAMNSSTEKDFETNIYALRSKRQNGKTLLQSIMIAALLLSVPVDYGFNFIIAISVGIKQQLALDILATVTKMLENSSYCKKNFVVHATKTTLELRHKKESRGCRRVRINAVGNVSKLTHTLHTHTDGGMLCGTLKTMGLHSNGLDGYNVKIPEMSRTPCLTNKLSQFLSKQKCTSGRLSVQYAWL